jgi:hypothetical protein
MKNATIGNVTNPNSTSIYVWIANQLPEEHASAVEKYKSRRSNVDPLSNDEKLSGGKVSGVIWEKKKCGVCVPLSGSGSSATDIPMHKKQFLPDRKPKQEVCTLDNKYSTLLERRLDWLMSSDCTLDRRMRCERFSGCHLFFSYLLRRIECLSTAFDQWKMDSELH